MHPSLLAKHRFYIRVKRMYICMCSMNSTGTYGNVSELSPSHSTKYVVSDPEGALALTPGSQWNHDPTP